MASNEMPDLDPAEGSALRALWAAREACERGRPDDAVPVLQSAIVALAAIQAPDPAAIRARADCCRLLAQILMDEDRVPEAMQAYQEAVDAYGRLEDGEGPARECAQQIVAGVRGLYRRPEERLNLLVARYDRELRQLAVQAGTELERAEMLLQLGTILQRRDRFAAARERYEAALALFGAGEDAPMRQALCHFRLAGLYHHELPNADLARAHYSAAIRLFTLHEPVSEGEQPNRVLCEMLLRSLDDASTA